MQKRLLLVPVAALVILGIDALAQAGPVVAVKPEALAPTVAPVPLDGAKKLARFTKAIAASKLAMPTNPAQSLEIKVTPIAPKHASGAQIINANPVGFFGAENGRPDGTFMMARPGDIQWPYSVVQISIPTTVGKLYVADCRLSPTANVAVKMSVSGAVNQSGDVEDGHFVFAWSASSATSTVMLTATAAPQGAPLHRVGFNGCEIGKLD